MPTVSISVHLPIQLVCACDEFKLDNPFCIHVQRVRDILDDACQRRFDEQRAIKGLKSGVWHETGRWDEQIATLVHVLGMPSLFNYQQYGSYLTARAIVSELNPDTVIDAPSGFGRNVQWLRNEGRTGAPRHIIAVDFDNGLLDTIRRYFPDVETVCADLATWYPEKPADLLYLQGLYLGKGGPRQIFTNLPKFSQRILVHESEDEFSQKEISIMMERKGYVRTRHHGPYINSTNKISTWVSLWELR